MMSFTGPASKCLSQKRNQGLLLPRVSFGKGQQIQAAQGRQQIACKFQFAPAQHNVPVVSGAVDLIEASTSKRSLLP